jgi:hypothetical protein
MKRLVGISILALAALVLWAPRGGAYETYSEARDLTNCRFCHGDFRDTTYVGASDGVPWGDDPHDVHRRTMLDSDCSTCHGANFFPVGIGVSDGGAGFPAIGCVGCHGRDADTGNDSLSAGYGAGLRQHHTNAGVAADPNGFLCADCHADADPGFYTPVGEDILPDYYFQPVVPDPNHPGKPTDSCNPSGEEDYAGSALGLDNDGNLDYDTLDAACCDDADGDTVCDFADNCPTIPNTGQTNSDGDVLGDACDNCVKLTNAPVANPVAGRTYTGGQLDDDADGYGNRCDGDFSNSGTTVGGIDTPFYTNAIGKNVADTTCLPGGTSPCDKYDVSGSGTTVGGVDTPFYIGLIGQVKDDPNGNWVKCPDCGVDFTNLPCVGDACP